MMILFVNDFTLYICCVFPYCAGERGTSVCGCYSTLPQARRLRPQYASTIYSTAGGTPASPVCIPGSYNCLGSKRVGDFRRASRSWEVAQWIPRSRMVLLWEICWLENRPLRFKMTRTDKRMKAAASRSMKISSFISFSCGLMRNNTQ